MSKYTDYFCSGKTQAEFTQYLIARLIAEYDQRGEVIPRHSFVNGKLQTDCPELRLRYRQALDGILIFTNFLDIVTAKNSNKEPPPSNP